MKTSAATKLVILFAGMAVVMAAQWRTASRLREENRDLQGVREQAKQARTELEQATQASARHESEAQSLRTEVVALRSEIQSVRHELERAKASAVQRHLPAAPSPVGFDNTPTLTPPPLGAAFFAALHQRQQYHMWPTIRTNLPPLSLDNRACSHYFWLDDLELFSGISKESVLSSPDWSPSQPLPLSFADAEQVARDEFRKLAQDESAWEVDSIALHRMWESGSPKWYYSVTLRPTGRPGFGEHPDSFTALVALSGRPGISSLATH